MTKGSEPAYPPNAGWRDNEESCRGLTKREAFAMAAMQGMFAAPSGCLMTEIAEFAVNAADALLAALSGDAP
jgi:hypothetical protein